MPSEVSLSAAGHDREPTVEELKRELAEARDHQTATGEVLSIISRSPASVQPVFEAIVSAAARLCNATFSAVAQFDGELLHLVAVSEMTPQEKAAYHTIFPRRPNRSFIMGRAFVDGRPVHVEDIEADPEYDPRTLAVLRAAAPYRTYLGIPIVRDGVPIGVIGCGRREVRSFSEAQIKFVKTFADQAVIAIENTRLFAAEQASKCELQGSLEYQTATAEVLSVISKSPHALQPVLDTIIETAARLCQADYARFRLLREGAYHVVARLSHDPDPPERHIPLRPGHDSVVGRVTLERTTIHIPDVHADPTGGAYALNRRIAARTVLGVPLLKQGDVVGIIMLFRDIPQAFSERQIELVETFANQATIAIENTRLFEAEQASKRELTESLEQQTATAEVLKVISRSALDVQKVLDALVESAARLCNAHDALIFQVFGDGLRLVAHHGQISLVGPVGQLTIPLARGSIGARAVIDRRTVHVADVLAEADEYPESRQRARQLGYRTALAVPLLHAGEAIGVIFIRRTEVRPFTERQIELVNTFADQAVIAIENTRLFEEVQARTRELAQTVEDLEIASQHKNQFVANMSHELRTPLAAILGYAELIQEGFYGALPEKSLDALTRIGSNGKHLLGLINTVLDIAKIESGQFTLHMTEYAIESMVETVRAATESLAQNKKLVLKTEVAMSLPVGLGDEQRLTQVLLNLVGNAIKFTDAGEVRIAATAVNGHFNVRVSDTGPGIPEEHQARIFEQFHQVDSSNTKAKGGTGLGLAIAKQIVEMHGGRIWVESTLGKGSTFQMEIPARPQVAKSD
jgi:signal transduction histidine kinase